MTNRADPDPHRWSAQVYPAGVLMSFTQATEHVRHMEGLGFRGTAYTHAFRKSGKGKNEVRTRQELFHEVADGMPVMMWCSGKEGIRDCFNQRWLDYRARTIEQEAEQGWMEGVHTDDLDHCRRICGAAPGPLRSFQVEYRLGRHDGAYRWVLDSGVPWILDDGTLFGHLGSCIEIHDLKLEEDALRASNESLQRQNQSLKELIWGASHDLQEPLRTIAAFTQLLTKSRETDRQVREKEFLQYIFTSVDRIGTLVRDLMNYSRVTDGFEPTAVESDCNLALEQALLLCRASIQETGAVVIRKPLPVVRAEEAALMQVFQNLISNAIKYRRPGEIPRIHVSVESAQAEWLFRVADNDIGFDPRFAKQIFGLFKRLHGRDEYGGSGLGLAICARIIEHHGGRIWAESQPGIGSQFFFTLPRG